MPRRKDFPAWLLRRGYFKRIERWAKPAGSVRAPERIEPETTAWPSNVVPFPERPGTVVRSELRGVNSA